MIPFGNQSVTLLHKADSGYSRHVIAGCSWRMKEVKAQDDGVKRKTIETTCRIPFGNVKPETGDVLILGDVNVSAGSEIELVRLLEAMRMGGRAAFRVQRIKNNAGGAPLPHYAASGE